MGNHTILLIEDDEDDIFFMRRAMKNAGVECRLQVCEDGEDAIGYLSGEGEYSDRKRFPWPSLILLDLKLPRKHGLEVLEWIRGNPDLSSTVVVILTSSRHAKDVASASQLGANSFLVKPPNIDDLSRLMEVIRSYWLENDQFVESLTDSSNGSP